MIGKLTERVEKKTDKKLIKQLLRQGRALDAAQIVRDSVNRGDLNAELRRIFQVRPIPFDEIYHAILQMDPKTIITTNYDELLEKNFEHYSGTEAHSISLHKAKHLLTDLRSPIRSIVKIHGCISDPSDLVLDRASYFRARAENPSLFFTVGSLMTVNTVLFVGYSISDPDIQLILENTNMHAKSDHPHYALMARFDHKSIRSALFDTYNVSFIEYQKGDHGASKAAILQLRDEVLALRASRGVV